MVKFIEFKFTKFAQCALPSSFLDSHPISSTYELCDMGSLLSFSMPGFPQL